MPATFPIPQTNELERVMTAVMIGVDPHKATHTAVVIGPAEEPLGELRVRASAGQAEKLVAWAADWPERTWAVEGAAGLGRLLAQQLVAAGERVLDVQPKLASRGRLLQAGDTNKNDPHDAPSVAGPPALARRRVGLPRRRSPLPRARPPPRLIRPPPGGGPLRHPKVRPPVAARHPPHQPRDPHGCDHPDPAQAQRRPRLLRQENS